MTPDKFVKTVVEKYQSFEGVFKDHKNAEDLAPNSDNVTKALFLFYVIQLDYATKSQRLYAGARELFDSKSEFFTPEFIDNLPELELRNYLEKYLKPRYINEAIKRYKANSTKLSDDYSSNPLLIFENSKSAKEALDKVRDFRGFGPKIGNFYVRTMINTFNYDYPDIESILPPVDVHDVRIAYLMGFIDSDKMTQKNILTTKELWSLACKNSKTSWLTFDKALWLLGSEGNPKSKKDIYTLLEI